MLRVAIVDDHRLFRTSLSMLVSTFPNVEVVLEAENGQALLINLPACSVDIVLLDIQMPQMDGYQTIEHLVRKFPEIKILVLSQITTRESIHRCIGLGAHGYFSKNSNPEQLQTAIFDLDDQGFYFGMELGSVLSKALVGEKPGKYDDTVTLSNRELDIIKMAAKEMSSAEIAEALFINVRTVETHRKRIMEKTGSKNFIGSILYAIRRDYITLP
ncbi:MAG: response regulator transcription factor [Sphingobacteriales bacterium]|nr:MAG: response regulator transcription factor [Sphingobacteriales bacterium]